MEKTTIAATMAVLIGILMVGSVLVPVIQIQSTEYISIVDENVGWARYSYIDESADYAVNASVDNSALTINTQTGDADDMIIWASETGSVVFSDGSFMLIYNNGGVDMAADLGSSASVTSVSGVVTVKDSTETTAATITPGWAYVPDANGTFGFFDVAGGDVGDSQIAAVGSFAGVTTYNNIDSINAGLLMTAEVSDGVFNDATWGLGGESTDSVNSTDTSVADTSGDWTYTIAGPSATITGYSGSAGDIIIPSKISDGTNTYTVTTLGSGSTETPIFDNTAIAGSTLKIPDSVTTINSYAFYGCSGFTGPLDIPNSVIVIGSRAFRDCSGFTSLHLPDNNYYARIQEFSFRGCTGFTGSLIIPEQVTMISQQAFWNCSGFDSLVFVGSPSIEATNSLNFTGVSEILNFGTTSIQPGSYGIPESAELRDDVPLMGYIATAFYSGIAEKSGAEYDLMRMLPIMVIAGILMASAVMFGLMRRNY